MDEVLPSHQWKLWPPHPLSAAEALPEENIGVVAPEGAGATLFINTEGARWGRAALHVRMPAWLLMDAYQVVSPTPNSKAVCTALLKTRSL